MLDQTFQHILDWGLGFIINSNRYGVETVPYGFGRHSSPRTFGHGGYQSSAAFADPERRLAVAIAFNGMPGEQTHNRRIRDTLTSLYEDLGLTDSETG
jgi:CubicO group peptidase (beta-lactamase class C family)